MNRLYRLYEASPEAAFTEIEDEVAELKVRLAAFSEMTDGLNRSLESALKTLVTRITIQPPPTCWSYDARLPNPYFDNLFEPEVGPDVTKRWVRSSGVLKTRLNLPRNVQYDFSISVVNFATPEFRESIRLMIDGKAYPWLSTENRIYSTIVLEDLHAEGLEFEVSVETELLPEDKDVSFSFSRIDIVRRGAAAP
jgi:hypothetical protein